MSVLDGSSLHAATTKIADYAAAAGKERHAAAANNEGQINDPVNGAAAIYAAVTAPNLPSRFQVGPDAIAMDIMFAPLMWRLFSGNEPHTEAETNTIIAAALSGLRT